MTVAQALAAVPAKRRQDAIWLLTSLLKCSRAELLLDSGRELSRQNLKSWRKSWARRMSGEPLQYIVGEASFWGRDFAVNRSVLIPRPETEILVELSLKLLSGQKSPKIIDVGTGSGAIAITLKLERPDAKVIASDISKQALAVAKRNRNRLGAKVKLMERNGLAGMIKEAPVDLIISNPPYLELSKDKVSREVMRWEPRVALEPPSKARSNEVRERAAWLADKFLLQCEELRPQFSAFELSPRVAALLEKRWRARPSTREVWREADLSGRKRFLLIAWENAQVRN